MWKGYWCPFQGIKKINYNMLFMFTKDKVDLWSNWSKYCNLLKNTSLGIGFVVLLKMELEEPKIKIKNELFCHDLNLGLETKAKPCKGAGRKWSLGITFHVPESVRGCEGMNPHIPKWAPTLAVRDSMDSRIFREWL